MTSDEDLKRRMRQLEFEMNQTENSPQKFTLKPEPQTKPKAKTRRIPLKYKILMWFVVGLVFFGLLSLIIDPISIYLMISSIFLLISTLSIVAIALVAIIPMLIILFIAWNIYKWLFAPEDK